MRSANVLTGYGPPETLRWQKVRPAEPELADAVAEGQRRHREGALFTIGRIQELGGLRGGLPPKHAQALFALSTNHEAWRELTEGHHLGWDTAEARLIDALTRSLLT